jgi:hypothetical protein
MEHPSWNKNQIVEELKRNAEDLGSAGWDEYYGFGSVSFHVNKYADLTINSATPASTWGTSSNVTVKASSSNYTINKYALLEGDVNTVPEPSNWKSVSGAGKSISETYNVTHNGTYTIWLKNSNNEIKRATFNVNKIDKDAPLVQSDLTATKVSDNSEKLSVKIIDAASGLDKIVWYYKANAESNYHTATDDLGGTTSAVTKEHTLTDLNAGSYTAYAKVHDKAGNILTVDSVTFTIQAPSDNVTITNLAFPAKWINTDARVHYTVTSENTNITHKKLVSGSSTTAPTSWTAVSSPAKTLDDEVYISENGTYTIWYKNAGGQTAYKSFTISKIDKKAPTVSKLAASNLTSSSAKLTVTANDNESGIASIEWKYKLASAAEYTTQTGTTTSITLNNLSVGSYVAIATVTDVAGNSTSSSQISFEIEEGQAPSDNVNITSVEVPSTWSNSSVNVTVKVSSENSNITHRALVNGTDAPAESAWTAISNPAKTLTDTVTVNANGTYTVWYKNAGGDTTSESFTVNKIDNTAPVIENELATSNPTENGIKLTVDASDAASGIKKIEWYYKLASASTYEVVTDTYANGEMFIGLADGKSHTFSNLAAGDYVAYAKIYDGAGNVTTTGQITFTIQGNDDPAVDPDDPTTDPVDDPVDEPVDPDTVNPKTNDGIAIFYMIGGAIVALGAAVAIKLRRR